MSYLSTWYVLFYFYIATNVAIGSIVIIGATSVADGNRVFYLFKQIAPQFDDTTAPVLKEQRYATRLAEMLSRVGEPIDVKKKKGRKRGAKLDPITGKVVHTNASNDDDDDEEGTEAEIEDMEAMRLAVMNALEMHHPDVMRIIKEEPLSDESDVESIDDLGVTSLMMAADKGQLSIVRNLLSMGFANVQAIDASGNTVVERLLAQTKTNTVAQTEILNLLQTHIIRHPT